MSSTKTKPTGEGSAKGTQALGRIGHAETAAFLASLRRAAPWDVWAEKLTLRKRPVSIHKLVDKTADSPLSWSLLADTDPTTTQLVEGLYRLSKRKRSGETPSDWSVIVVDWLEALPSRPVGPELAIELVAWAHALPRLGTRLSAELWAELFAALVNASIDALEEATDGSESDVGPATGRAADQLALIQMTAGELPLTLGYVFPKIELCVELASRGTATLDDGILRSMDGEGIPHSWLVRWWQQLLACWTRCVMLERRISSVQISREAKLQFEWFVRQSLRWRAGDGGLPFNPTPLRCRSVEQLVAAAISVAGDRIDRDLYTISKGQLKPDDSDYSLPFPGEHSEWSQLAVLRSSWQSKRANHLAVSFNEGHCLGQLTCGQIPVWAGDLMPEVRVEGKRVSFVGDWEEVCWSSDDDMDYIELEIELKGSWKLQRQLMVAREDDFVYLADAVLGPRSAPIDYRLELPWRTEKIECSPQDETTEIRIETTKPLGWILPLALPEWKVDRHAGMFDGRTLHQTANGSAIYTPLFFDLNAKRRSKTHTWRQLTVAQDLDILSRDVAVAYRIQVGRKQWVVYRSLGPTGNRTFMGHNLISEFLVARFLKNGEVENLIEIE